MFENINQGHKFITLKGMENATRSKPTAVAEHIDMFKYQADKATNLMERLFSWMIWLGPVSKWVVTKKLLNYETEKELKTETFHFSFFRF